MNDPKVNSPTPAASGLEVLILAPEEKLAAEILSALEAAAPGTKAAVASSLGEAQQLVVDQKPSLFVLDVDATYDLAQEFLYDLRTSHPNARAIILTAIHFSAQREQVAGLGAIHFLEKPFPRADFMTLVEALLAPGEKREGERFQGTLSDLHIADIIQLKCISGATSVLEFTGPRGEKARVHFENGQVRHATAPGKEGRAAFNEIVDWKGGMISEVPVPLETPRTIDLDWQVLLMEAVRKIDETESQASRPWATPAPSQKARTVLVIDDSAMLLSFVQEILEENHYNVLTAATAEEGLALSRSAAPDLILLDFILPDRKGDEVCRQLMKDPATSKIPVVYVSGFGSDLQADRGEIPNVIGSLNKPFTSETLINAVREYLPEEKEAPQDSQATPAEPAAPAPAAEPTEPGSLPEEETSSLGEEPPGEREEGSRPPAPEPSSEAETPPPSAAAESSEPTEPHDAPPSSEPAAPTEPASPAPPAEREEAIESGELTAPWEPAASMEPPPPDETAKPAIPIAPAEPVPEPELELESSAPSGPPTSADAAAPLASDADTASRGAYFCGDSSFFSLHWALQTIAREKLTGILRAFWTRDSIELWAREGRVVMVTTRNPALYCEEAPVTLLNVERERVDAARARQAKDGCPLFVTLAEEGLILREPGLQLVQHYGQKLFSQLWTDRVRFIFEQQDLPGFSREILAGEESIDQWALSTLRFVQYEELPKNSMPETSSIPAYTRDGFERVQELRLTVAEAQFASQFNGNRSIAQISKNLRLDIKFARLTLFRFLALEIVECWPGQMAQKSEPRTGLRGMFGR